jgi:SNF2 family DNA or RNA helicase
MSEQQKLLAAFNKLKKPEQQILYVLSVLYRPLNQTSLKEVLVRLGWKDHQGKSLSGYISKSWRESMLKNKLIQNPQGALSCAPAIVDSITRHYGDAIAFAEIVAKNSANFLPKPQGWLLTNESYNHRLLRLRVALYLDNEDEIWDILRIKQPDIVANPEDVHMLLELCVRPLNLLWLQQRSAQVQLQVLAPLMLESCEDLNNRNKLFSVINDGRKEGAFVHPAFDYMVAEQQLYRGQMFTDDLIAKGDPSAQAQSLRGWQAFLQDDNSSALAFFEKALVGRRKQTRKRNILLPGMGGLFYLLALFKSNTPEHTSLLEKQVDYAEKLRSYTPLLSFARTLMIVAHIRSGKRPETDIKIIGSHVFEAEPVLSLLCALGQKWMGEKVDETYIKAISEYAQQAYENDFLWYAQEVAILLSDLGLTKNNKHFKNAQAVVKTVKKEHASLSAIVKVQQPWERALGALAALNPPVDSSTQAAVDVSASKNRLVWFIEKQGYQLHPKEQKTNKKGQWSKGRPVALKRLSEEAQTFDYLTDADKKICQTISIETSYSYGGYTQQEYFLPNETALQAAVGHPHLYWPDASQPVELKKVEPELHIQKRNTKLVIHIKPVPNLIHSDSSNCVVSQPSDHRLELVSFSDKHIQIATILGKKGLTVPASAEQQVLQSLSAIAPLLTVHSDIAGLSNQGEEVQALEPLLVQLQPSGQGLSLSVYSQPLSEAGPLFEPGMGAASVFADINGKKMHTSRNLKHEKASLQELLQQCPTLQSGGIDGNNWQLEDNDNALSALLELQEMADNITLQWPQGSPIKIRPAKDLDEMQVSVRQQRDWFELEGQLSISDEEVISLQNLMTLLDETPGRFVKLKDGEFLALTQNLQQRLRDLQKYTDDGRFHPLASPVLDELTQGMNVESSPPWKKQIKRLQQAYKLTPELPSTLQASLRDYQIEGFQWLSRLAHWGAGACLADDMGLGKTLQSLALILSRAANGPTLVLAPTSVCFNWQDEALKFTPSLNVQLFGSGDRKALLANAGPFDVIVCSYGLLQTESKGLQGVHWHTLIADEAQALKNPQTKRSKAAMLLNADFKMVVTGTPIENHLGELWNLFNLINPGLLGSLENFNERFANPIEGQQDTDVGQQLKQLIQPFILRRLKSEVLTELPSRTEITIHVEPSLEEKAFYEALRRNALVKLAENDGANAGQQRMKMLAEIMRLRRACCHPQLVMPESNISSAKLDAFSGIITELIDNKHKALVFSQFVGHLDILREHLDQQGIHYQYLDGSTPAKKRQQAVNAFQAGEGDLFLISLKAGGSGLNLTAADYVIHMDPWWNPAVEDQASDRAHRMGQKRPVTIYRLIVQGTIEDKIVKMHQQKRDLANNLLEGTGASGKISLDEMMNLIKGV